MILCVEHGKTPERDVGSYHIEIVVVMLADSFKPLDKYPVRRMQIAENPSGQQIIFKPDKLFTLIGVCKRIKELPYPG